jgi:hypothetical protein
MRDEWGERLAEAIGQWQLDVALVGADMDFEPAHLTRVLAPVVDGIVAEALRSPYNEDGYCEGCGNISTKPHAPDCGWADLRDAKVEAWDEGWRAAQQVLDFEGRKVWAHTVLPDEANGNPYREGR